MIKYVIKVTYLEGAHKGKEFYLDKDGYVIGNLEYVWQDGSYTEKACKAACTRKTKKNISANRFELLERARREKDGKTNSKYMLNDLQSFEPFAIETVDK